MECSLTCVRPRAPSPHPPSAQAQSGGTTTFPAPLPMPRYNSLCWLLRSSSVTNNLLRWALDEAFWVPLWALTMGMEIAWVNDCTTAALAVCGEYWQHFRMYFIYYIFDMLAWQLLDNPTWLRALYFMVMHVLSYGLGSSRTFELLDPGGHLRVKGTLRYEQVTGDSGRLQVVDTTAFGRSYLLQPPHAPALPRKFTVMRRSETPRGST